MPDAVTEPAPAELEAAAPPPAEPAAPLDAASSRSTVDYGATAESDESDGDKKKGPLKELKLAVGVRLGYGLPFGDFSKDRALEENVAGALPIAVDAALRLRGTELGVYGQLLAGFAGDTLESGCSDCSVFGYRFGLQANYHALPEQTIDPWIGLGVGIETISFFESRTVEAVTNSGDVVEIDIDRTTSFSALPELTLQGGVDIGGAPIAIGPFVSFSLAKYSDYEIKVDCNDFRCSDAALYEVDGEVPEQAWHSWLIVGLRGSYVPF